MKRITITRQKQVALKRLQALELEEKQALELEAAMLKTIHEIIDGQLKQNGLFCGMILTKDDVYGILSLLMEGNKTVKVGYRLYVTDEEEVELEAKPILKAVKEKENEVKKQVGNEPNVHNNADRPLK